MQTTSRRNFLKNSSRLAAGSVLAGNTLLACKPVRPSRVSTGSIRIDPTPLFDINPGFYMQFLEPLGFTEPTIEASWDYARDNWRQDYVDCISDLNPGLIRWGGNFIRYYKWREGIGPAAKRPWMYNYYWGGKETNRVGTHELMDLCKRTGAGALMNVNFNSDGVKRFLKTGKGEMRCGSAKEAADWVSYCNDPENSERKKNGSQEPFDVKLWQLGNETSYSDSHYSLEEAIKTTKVYAKAMRQVDPSIKLIGWGDAPNPGLLRQGQQTEDNAFWADKMIPEAGDLLDYIAIHMMWVYPEGETVLTGYEYQKDPERAWNELLDLGNIAAVRLDLLRERLSSLGSEHKVAITEGHLSLSPYNTNTILTEWLSAAYHARTFNTYLRNADMVGIATGADFSGTRWTVNAVRIPVPRGDSFLLPIGSIMRLYKKYGGDQGIQVLETPSDLDIAATRKGNKVFLHVLNTNYTQAVDCPIEVEGWEGGSARVYEIAPEDPRAYVDRDRPDTFLPVEKEISVNQLIRHSFPPASVSLVELQIS